ncbi:MAG: DUF4982 domain-containing protein, partial [Oscillospiraceae bacterium]|nr:DUF4982 domain-containing protein [Oscillospiraceae bacterium]
MEKRRKRKKMMCLALALLMLFTTFPGAALANPMEPPEIVEVVTLVTEQSEPEVPERTFPAMEERAAQVQVIDVTEHNHCFSFDWQFLLATRTPQIANADGTGPAPTQNASAWADNGLLDPVGMPNTAEIIDMGFDDSDWRTLNVPHDWSFEGMRGGPNTNAIAGQGFTQGGLGWYRKTFYVPDTFEDAGGTTQQTNDQKRFIVEFEGVYKNSTVWVNEQKFGTYPSGYTGFAYDITDAIQPGGENVIVVRVENMNPSGRWYSGSGILRPVNLIVKNNASFDRHGIILRTPDLRETYLADGSAELHVSANAFNTDFSNGSANMRISVIDSQDNVVVSEWYDAPTPESPIAGQGSNPNTAHGFHFVVEVPDVNLWWTWDTGDPYLYTIRAELFYADVNATELSLVDTVDIRWGFRWIHTDPDRGFFLNDTLIDLRGTNLHSNFGALGAAVNEDALRRQFRLLMGMGINSFRSAHYPHSNQTMAICSELGILVVDENFDGWGGAKATFDIGTWFLRSVPGDFPGIGVPREPDYWRPMPADAELLWSDWITREMVLRGINEPSIVMWSIGNEVRGVGSRRPWFNPNYLWRGLDGNMGASTEEFFTDDEVATNPALDHRNIALDQFPRVTTAANAHNVFTEALRLRNIVHDLDPTRYIVYGGDHLRSAMGSGGDWLNVARALDGFGFNYNSAHSLDVLYANLRHVGRRGTFFFEAESSSATSTRGKYQSPRLPQTPADDTPGNRGVSSYDNNLTSWTMPHEYGLKKNRDRDFFAGMFIWGGIDYFGEPTPWGAGGAARWPVVTANFGAIDIAGFPKASYHAYRATWNCWTEDPFAVIVPDNWTDWQVGEHVDVWVYTNAGSARLYLNGECLGEPEFRFERKRTFFDLYYWETDEPTFDASGGTFHTGLRRPASNPFGYTSPTGPREPANIPTGSGTGTIDNTDPRMQQIFATGDGATHGKIHLTWVVPFEPGELKVVAYNPVRETPSPNDPLPQGTTYEVAVAQGLTAEHSISTAGIPYTFDMTTPDNTYLLPDGRSLMFVEIDVVDEYGERVPSANNLLEFEVEGPAYIFGVDNGATETVEAYKWWPNYWDTSIENQANAREKTAYAERSAWMGKALVVLIGERGGSGDVTLTVTSQGMVPAVLTASSSPTDILPTVTHPTLNPAGATIAAPRTVQALQGVPIVSLPRDVNVTFGDITIPRSVTWNAIPDISFDALGPFTVTGTFDDAALSALAPSIIIDVVPMIADRFDHAFNDDLTGDMDGAPDGAFEIPRAQWFEHVSSVTGETMTTGAIATASHTTGGTTQSGAANMPNHMINGTGDGVFWDNRSVFVSSAVVGGAAGSPLNTGRARANDFVEVFWPSERTFDQVSLNFITPVNYIIPIDMIVQYWDGFAWVEAENQFVVRATANNQPTTIFFDPVASSRVRVFMQAFDQNDFPYPMLNPIEGSFRISTMQVTWGRPAAFQTIEYTVAEEGEYESERLIITLSVPRSGLTLDDLTIAPANIELTAITGGPIVYVVEFEPIATVWRGDAAITLRNTAEMTFVLAEPEDNVVTLRQLGSITLDIAQIDNNPTANLINTTADVLEGTLTIEIRDQNRELVTLPDGVAGTIPLEDVLDLELIVPMNNDWVGFTARAVARDTEGRIIAQAGPITLRERFETGPNLLTNPGFEQGTNGWTQMTTGGNNDGIRNEPGNNPRNGDWHFNYWRGANAAYPAGTRGEHFQTVNIVEPGIYTFGIWAQGTGDATLGDLFLYVELTPGDPASRVIFDIGREAMGQPHVWFEMQVEITEPGPVVVGVRCTLSGTAGVWRSFDDYEFFLQGDTTVWVERAPLREAIEDANAQTPDPGVYTAGSIAAFEAARDVAVAAAEDVLGDADATQEEVDAALTALNNAMEKAMAGLTAVVDREVVVTATVRDETPVVPGAEILVDFVLTENPDPGIGTLQIILESGDLTILRAAVDTEPHIPFSQGIIPQVQEGRMVLGFQAGSNENGNVNVTGTGYLVTVRFLVPADAEVGDTLNFGFDIVESIYYAVLEGTSLRVNPVIIPSSHPSGNDTVTVVAPFVPVTAITKVSALTVAANTPLTLAGTVVPADATNTTIVWSGTGVENGVLTATAAGTVTVTATVVDGTAVGTNFTQTFEIVVTAPVVSGIAVTTQPTLTYTVGDTLDLSGLVVTLTYDNGDIRTVAFADFAANGLTANPAAGTALALTHNGTPVTITHTASGETAATNNLTVTAPVVSGIAVTTQPTLTYTVGDTLDLSGLVVTLTYNNGDTRTVAFADFAANGLTVSPAAGTALALTHNGTPVTITHTASNETAATNNLTVTAPVVTGIAVT